MTLLWDFLSFFQKKISVCCWPSLKWVPSCQSCFPLGHTRSRGRPWHWFVSAQRTRAAGGCWPGRSWAGDQGQENALEGWVQCSELPAPAPGETSWEDTEASAPLGQAWPGKTESWLCGVELQEVLMPETKQEGAQSPPLNMCSTQAELTLLPLKSPGLQLRVSPHLIIGICGYLMLPSLTEWEKKHHSLTFIPLSCCFLPELTRGEMSICCFGIIVDEQERLFIFPGEERLKEWATCQRVLKKGRFNCGLKYQQPEKTEFWSLVMKPKLTPIFGAADGCRFWWHLSGTLMKRLMVPLASCLT